MKEVIFKLVAIVTLAPIIYFMHELYPISSSFFIASNFVEF